MKPVLFSLGSYDFNALGTLVLVGIVLAAPGIVRDAAGRGFGGERRALFVADFYLAAMLGGAIGGRVLHLLLHPADFGLHGLISGSGFSFFGALAGTTLALVGLARRYGLAPGSVVDLFATWLPFGHAFGRVGCLLAGCCWGAPSTVPWAIELPPGTPAFSADGMAHDGAHTVGLHPSQVYEAVVLVGLAVWMLGRRLRVGPELPWRATARYVAAYAGARVLLDTVRGDAVGEHLLEVHLPALARALGVAPDHPPFLSTSQAAAVVGATLAAIALVRFRARGAAAPAAAGDSGILDGSR